jgi:ABC-type branched-subunit amino acid transport system substrate-binding protein
VHVRTSKGSGDVVGLTRIVKKSRLVGAFRYNARRLWKETRMKRTLTSFACLLMLATAFAQEQKKSAPASPASEEESVSAAPILEVKIRKAWEDYNKRNKEASPLFSPMTLPK